LVFARYLNICQENRHLEIGGTWYAVAYQRTLVNTESKYMLLNYALENLDCIRVQFKTDARNNQSQRALERIGAMREGVFRNHMILPDGQLRDSVFYSIIYTEWFEIKSALEKNLGKSYPLP
jgi:RimJ/RimL family protein N-acetyltransferase